MCWQQVALEQDPDLDAMSAAGMEALVESMLKDKAAVVRFEPY